MDFTRDETKYMSNHIGNLAVIKLGKIRALGTFEERCKYVKEQIDKASKRHEYQNQEVVTQ